MVLVIFTAMCQQAHWTRLSLLQVKFSSKGNHQLQSSRRRLLATESTSAYQCQPESTTYTRRESGNTFLISSFTKQVFEFSNKSTMLADLIKNYSQEIQKVSNTILCHIKMQRRMWNKTVTWNDMKFQRSRIVFNAMQKCLRYSRPVETCCDCGRMLQDITEVVKKQAEQRINSRYMMYVLRIHDALKNRQHRKNSKEQQIT